MVIQNGLLEKVLPRKDPIEYVIEPTIEGSIRMLNGESRRVANKAKPLYEEKYRRSLEQSHRGEFVCIEPESGDYFLGRTFDDAVNQAIDVADDDLFFADADVPGN